MLKKSWNAIVGFLLAGLMVAEPCPGDTVFLNEGEEVKGLIVEEHEDRIILSTVDGEVPLMRDQIRQIEYDEPEYSLLNLGRQMEKNHKFAVAMAYYQEAIKINPDLQEARDAVLGIRSKLWAYETEGEISEVSKQQDFRDAWQANTSVADIVEQRKSDDRQLLWDRLGLRLTKTDHWIQVSHIKRGGEAYTHGMRQKDLIVAIDGKSCRYLDRDFVVRSFLEPRFANMTLRIQRTVAFPDLPDRRRMRYLGIKLKLNYEGLSVVAVKPDSPAAKRGIEKNDLVVEVNGNQTRYTPLSRANKMIEDSESSRLVLIMQKTFQLTRR